MASPLPHERPAWLLLPPGADVGAALVRALGHADVRVHALPPLWFLDAAQVDLPARLPGVAALTRETLPRVVQACAAACTPEALQALAGRAWREAEEPVRQHFLRAGTLATFAAIFGLKRKSRDVPPPPAFVGEQVFTYRLECQYRLAPEPTSAPTPAPPEEGSLIVYPFDLAGHHARADGGQPVGGLIECFAYAWQHERHEAFWQRLAGDLGARLELAPYEAPAP